MDSEVAPTEPGKPAAADASQPLIGTLEDYSPAGVLQVLSSQGETGAVRFNGEGGCTVYLHEGQLYFAETTDTGEALAIALVRPGRLSPDDWDDATAAGYPTQEVGQELINTGAIDRELLASVVLSVIYDPLISLFRQGEGDFEFEPGTVHWMGPFRSFAVDAIVSEVRRRVREADEMAPLIPTLDVWVESARSLPSDRGTVNLRRDDWEIVVAAAGGRSLPDLAIELGRGMWSTARLVYRLASVHLLDVTAAPAEGYVDEAAGGSEPATSGLGAATTAFADTPGFLGEADVETDEPSTDSDTGFADAAPVGHGGFLPAPEEAAEPETLDPVEADDIHGADVVDDPAAPAEDIVDLSSPIAAGEGPPALLDWDTPSTDAAPATEGDTWGETAWDDQPWDAPSSTPEGGPSWDAPPPPAAPDATQAWADEGSWQNSSWDQPATEGATDEADDDHDATVVGLGAAGLAAEVVDAPDAPDTDTDTDTDSAAPAASGDHGITFDAPTLHPDIAKALAESTYADSATAINAMAARLGAGADDDTDDVDESWDAAPVAQTAPEGSGDEFEQFWAGDGEERAFPWEAEPQGAEPDAWAGSSTETGEDIGLTWQPTSWDTGVETAPLPQRDRVRPEGEDDHGPIGAADPEWLENLYSQFMANGEAPAGKRRGNKETNPVESAFAADPASLPKTKPLRRVIDAIRRL